MGEAPFRVDLRAEPDRDLSDVVEHLKAGGLVAYPTETVYGFGSLADDRGVAALRELKSRDEAKPFILLIPSAEAASGLVWTDEARELVEIFWPGALTLVLSDPEERFPAGVRSERGTVAVRVSPDPTVQRLLTALGEPITSSSANAPGEAPARSGTDAVALLERMGRDDVWVLDAGTLEASDPSTIVDFSDGSARVLRQGSVPVGRLRCALPDIGG